MKVDEMREAFFEFDIDGDGTITTKVSTLQNDFFYKQMFTGQHQLLGGH